VDYLARSAAAAFDRVNAQEELARQALLDPLTGVANRRHFDREMHRLNASADRAYGLVLCDLDHFKTVNDRLGHEAGDELLRIAAARLTSSVRSSDIVARLGGDEFVVLVPGVTEPAALARIRDNIETKFRQRVKVGRWQLSSLPCSLGVAVAPRDGRTPREVLRSADESMYDAKRARRVADPRVTVTLPGATVVTLPGDDALQIVPTAHPRVPADDAPPEPLD
jgi:diguanylate cyclase (GGDEF)-like protein